MKKIKVNSLKDLFELLSMTEAIEVSIGNVRPTLIMKEDDKFWLHDIVTENEECISVSQLKKRYKTIIKEGRLHVEM